MSRPVAGLRTSGSVSRTWEESTEAALWPLPHSAPWLTGNSARPSTVGPSVPGSTFMPHCRAQYGQWVGVAVVLSMPLRVRRVCCRSARLEVT